MHQVCTIDHYILMTIYHYWWPSSSSQTNFCQTGIPRHERRWRSQEEGKVQVDSFSHWLRFWVKLRFSSGFRQRPWWVFCRRNTWFRSRRWSTTARSSWTSTTSWAKWRSFRREPFLHLSIKQQSVHISYRVQSDLDRRESLQRLTSTDIFRLELQNLFIAKCFQSFTFCTFIWFQRINKY